MKEISIIPHHQISDSIDGLLIETTSIDYILAEINLMGLTISDVYLYGLEKNLYFLRLLKNPSYTRGHLVYYLVNNKIYIPTDSRLSFQLLDSDYTQLFSHHLYLIHPTFGMYQLDQMIDWEDVIYVEENHQNIKIPALSVFIPKEIQHVEVDIELDDKEFETSLKADEQSDEDWMKSLPFNLQKVLKGNKIEAEKLLLYLDKHPERIDKLGIPLDTLNSFSKNSLENPLKYDFGQTSKTRNIFLVILTIGLLLFFGIKIMNMYTSDDDVKRLSTIQQEINTVKTNVNPNDSAIYSIPAEPIKEEEKEKVEEEKSISSTGAFFTSLTLLLLSIIVIKYRKEESVFTGVSLVNSLIMGFLIVLIISFIVYFVINNLTFGIISFGILLLLGHSLYKFLIITIENLEDDK